MNSAMWRKYYLVTPAALKKKKFCQKIAKFGGAAPLQKVRKFYTGKFSTKRATNGVCV